MAAHAWDKRGESTRKRPAPLPVEAAAGARAGGEGLRLTGCSLTAYFVGINSPSSLACWLSTSASQPGPGVGGRVRGRGSEDHPPRLPCHSWGGGWPASSSKVPFVQATCSRSSRKPSHTGGGGGSVRAGHREHALPPPTETPCREERPGSLRPSLIYWAPTVRRSQLRGGLTAPQVQMRILRPRHEVSWCTPGDVPPGCRHWARSQGPRDPRCARWQAGGDQRPASRRRSPPQKHGQAGCTSGPPLRRGHLWK